MKGGRLAGGYTIIEVMIVLAVSGVMFLIAANFISGKQEKTSFQQGSNQFASQMQDLIEQVTDGQFTDIPVNCDDSGGSLTFPPLAPPQSNCVLLGKIVHFAVGTGATSLNQYEVYTIASARVGPPPGYLPIALQPTGNPFSQTLLAPVTPSLLTKQAIIPQDLDVGAMHVIDSSTGTDQTTAYSIGFFEGLGSVDTVHGGYQYQSGTQTILMVYAAALKNIPANTATINMSTVKIATSATICLTDGVRSANIIIGAGTDNQLQVQTQQLGAVGCS